MSEKDQEMNIAETEENDEVLAEEQPEEEHKSRRKNEIFLSRS